MRKITEQAVNALANGTKFSSGNTVVSDGKLFLHGNNIVSVTGLGSIDINLCGWNTPTTRERINGVLRHYRMGSISTKQGQAMLNGNSIPDNGWVRVTN